MTTYDPTDPTAMLLMELWQQGVATGASLPPQGMFTDDQKAKRDALIAEIMTKLRLDPPVLG